MASSSISIFILLSLSLFALSTLGQTEDWKCRTRNFMPTSGGCLDYNFSWMFCSSSDEHADGERDAANRIFTSSLHENTITWGVTKICALTGGKPKANSVMKYCSVLAASNSPCDDTVCALPQTTLKSNKVVFCCDFCEDQVNTICEPIEGIRMDRSAYCAPVIRSSVALAQYMMPTCMRKPNACYDPRTTSQMDIIQASMDLVSDGSSTVVDSSGNEAAIIADDLSGLASADVAVPIPTGSETSTSDDSSAVVDAMPSLVSADDGSAIIADMPPSQEDDSTASVPSAASTVTVGNTIDSSESAVISDQMPSQDDAPTLESAVVDSSADMPMQVDGRSVNPAQIQHLKKKIAALQKPAVKKAKKAKKAQLRKRK